MNTRAYSNYAGQQFVRTSDTHGRRGDIAVEFETEAEMNVWLGQKGFVGIDEEFPKLIRRIEKDAA